MNISNFSFDTPVFYNTRENVMTVENCQKFNESLMNAITRYQYLVVLLFAMVIFFYMRCEYIKNKKGAYDE